MKEELVQKLVEFVRGVGIPVFLRELEGKTFLPGLIIENGSVVIDEAKLVWPGDILHEAGHIAVTPPSRRGSLGGKIVGSPAEEMAAMAWSYAALVSLGLDPAVVFHEGGYKKGGAQLIEQFSSGRPPGGPGVPMLQWYGMTTGFPQMNSWLREGEDPE